VVANVREVGSRSRGMEKWVGGREKRCQEIRMDVLDERKDREKRREGKNIVQRSNEAVSGGVNII
jgi:hypothetical protein